MDTRALDGEFLPRREIHSVERKTETQYTALIQLTGEEKRKRETSFHSGRRRQRYRDHSEFSVIDNMCGINSAFGKYSDPLTLSIFGYVTALFYNGLNILII